MFGRKKRLRAIDRLNGASWHCAGCGQTHRGMFSLAASSPDVWEGAEAPEANSCLRLDGDFLSEDFCVLRGEHFFVRCSFEIPVHGLPEAFGFGIWSTLSRANFELYLDGFDSGEYAEMGPWFGWFSNELQPFGPTLNQKCQVHPQLHRRRPLISMLDPANPLAIAQEEGISPERVMDLYAYYGCHPAP